MARAIEHGDVDTGVTVIRMSPRVDAGGMLSTAKTHIGPDETAGEVEARLSELGAPLIVAAIASIVEGEATFLPQDPTAVTKAPKLSKESGKIAWTKPASAVHNLVRAMQPWPMASTIWDRGPDVASMRLIIHSASVVDATGEPGLVLEGQGDRFIIAAGDQAVRILRLQPEGKKPMDSVEFLRGHRPAGSFLR